MPAQRAVLHDILVNGLDPTKKYSNLSKGGTLKQESQPKERANENIFASKQKSVTSQKDVKKEPEALTLQEPLPLPTSEEVKESVVVQPAEAADQSSELSTEENLEEKPKKKLFQKKKSKDDVVF